MYTFNRREHSILPNEPGGKGIINIHITYSVYPYPGSLALPTIFIRCGVSDGVTFIWLHKPAPSSQVLRLSNFILCPVGISHPNITCCACHQQHIHGMRWKCTMCPDVNLCTPCYYNGDHSLEHAFSCIISNGDGCR